MHFGKTMKDDDRDMYSPLIPVDVKSEDNGSEDLCLLAVDESKTDSSGNFEASQILPGPSQFNEKNSTGYVRVVVNSDDSSNPLLENIEQPNECGECCDRFLMRLKLFDTHWPLTFLLALTFLGFWLPRKRKSIWILTGLPVVHLLFGLGAHFYFMLSSNHRSVHIGSKMLLTALWISGFSSYVIALYSFKYKSLECIKDLKKKNYRFINAALFTGLILVSLVLFGDAHYQVIFDLDNIKKALLANCTQHVACNWVFYFLAASIYWGMFSSVAVCCVFLSLCLIMINDLSEGYARITQCTGDVTETLRIHKQIREQLAERTDGIQLWFMVHMIFYIIVILANLFEWWEAASDMHFAYEYMAQIVGTLVVAYKFFFPFLSASYVTWHESMLVQELNDKNDFKKGQTFYSRQDLEVFLQQSKRRGYGFRLFKIQITLTLAIFSLLGSGFGLMHNMMKH